MKYQIGQAVMYDGRYERNQLGFVFESFEDGRVWLCDLDGDELNVGAYMVQSAATEAEILEQAVKHGWELERPTEYATKQGAFILLKEKVWIWKMAYDPYQYELKEYCEEGLIAHRLITALNLAKQ
jgi:hypothetical protein